MSIPQSTRPLLSSTEKNILNELVQSLTKTESQFCCGGIIKVPASQKLSLFYCDTNRQARSLDLPLEHIDKVKELLNACTPSPHGHGNETVYDESYRLACELHQGSFALTVDVLNENDVLATIATLTSPRSLEDLGVRGMDKHNASLTHSDFDENEPLHSGTSAGSCSRPVSPSSSTSTPSKAGFYDTPRLHPVDSQGIVARLYKLNAYTTGGFFKAHRDTPKSARHIGTLVVALPIPFQGGALRVSHEGKQVLFDWGKDLSRSTEEIDMPWVFLFSDVEHEVLPVTDGTRVTLAYDIFASEQPMLLASSTMDSKTLPLYPELKAALHNQAFLPQGGKVAVALSHVYPINARNSSKAFASHLKGSDAAFYRVLLTLGVPIYLCAVFSPYDTYDLYQEALEKLPRDGFGPFRGTDGNFELLYTSQDFEFSSSNCQWEEGETSLLEEVYKANLDVDIIWARKPAKEEYLESGYYAAYGNGVSLETIYAAAALVLEIPPVGNLVRAAS